MPDDLKERLHTIARGDHDRGCAGRTYSCHCGYDEQAWETADQAADRIEYLEARIGDLERALIEVENHGDRAAVLIARQSLHPKDKP